MLEQSLPSPLLSYLLASLEFPHQYAKRSGVPPDVTIGGDQFELLVDLRQADAGLPWEYGGAFPVVGRAFVHELRVKFSSDLAEAYVQRTFQAVPVRRAGPSVQKHASS